MNQDHVNFNFNANISNNGNETSELSMVKFFFFTKLVNNHNSSIWLVPSFHIPCAEIKNANSLHHFIYKNDIDTEQFSMRIIF